MKHPTLIVITLFSALYFFGVGASAQNIESATVVAVKNEKKWDDHSVIVKFKSSLSFFQERTDIEPFFSSRQSKTLNLGSNLMLVSDLSRSAEDLMQEYLKKSSVQYVEPNYLVSLQTIPNDTSFSESWALNNTGQLVNGVSGTVDADIDAPEGWALATGSASVTVAVIDSGIAPNHPDFSSRIVQGYDFVDDDSTPIDLNGHGTHVAGIIAAAGNNAEGSTGISWNSKIMPIRAFNMFGLAFTSDVIAAVDYAVSRGVKIINYSAGSLESSQGLYDAIDAARLAGVLFVTAAGNTGADIDIGLDEFYPCNFDLENIICVAASDQNDALASYSNYGTTSVDIVAPGSNIFSSLPYVAVTENFNDALLQGFDGTIFSESGSSSFWRTQIDPFGDGSAYSTETTMPYESNAEGILESEGFDSAGHTAVLTFDLITESQFDSGCNIDYLAVEIWNGASWQLSGRFCGDFEYAPAYLDISSHVNAGMKIRYRWVTDDADNDYHGDWIDNMKVTYPDENEASYGYEYGTSMATPHVAGLAALVKSVNPTLTYSEIKNYILENGDIIPGLSNVVTSKRINVFTTLDALDVAKPTGSVIINNNVTSLNNPVVDLAITATDVGYGVSKMRFSNNGSIWTGWSSYGTSYEDWDLQNAIYGGNNSQGSKTLYIQFKDIVGNASKVYSDSIIYDTGRPNGTIKINSDATYTNNALVSLSLSASDSLSQITFMRFSNDGIIWSGWYRYSSTFSWNANNVLFGGNTSQGSKRVYVIFKDSAVNVSLSTSDTINYDSIVPTGTMQINGGSTSTTNPIVQLNMTHSADARFMRISNNGISWTGWRTYASPYSWSMIDTKYGGTSSKGTKRVYVQFRDPASNVSTMISDWNVLK